MKKKYSLIFLIPGVILIILFALYNYTDLFIKKESEPVNDNKPVSDNKPVNDNNLNISLTTSSGKSINVILDSNLYEEVLDNTNSNNKKVVKNKNNGIETILMALSKIENITIGETISLQLYLDYGVTASGYARMNEQGFYKYDDSKITKYAYLVDDNTALLVIPNNNEINLNDFKNIK